MLEASATRRDAKGYLQKYASKKNGAAGTSSSVVTSSPRAETDPSVHESVNAAVVRLSNPQQLSSDTLYGIAKTLSQLRVLGLLALVVVDCGINTSRQQHDDEALRLCDAINTFGKPGAKLVDQAFVGRGMTHEQNANSVFSSSMRVDDYGSVRRALQRGMIVVIPSLARESEISSPRPAASHATVLALTKYLSGMQFEGSSLQNAKDATILDVRQPGKIASVERVILLDPVGGTPMASRPEVSHRFINLEQEFEPLIKYLRTVESQSNSTKPDQGCETATSHAANLCLAKDALSGLPSTSSALITTPLAAASIRMNDAAKLPKDPGGHSIFGFNGMVTSGSQRNPLLHNLLTDRPVFSPSLPLQRMQDGSRGGLQSADSGSATLVKRGMPVTIYPDPRISPWQPPKPGSPRLRLTDNCIDLPRLVHLIEDSFNRKLDVQDYLKRVNDNLAGIIIAGEYEGGAILTWERPEGVDEHTAYENGQLVPYLDKFAVLKSRQGSGGVADIVFNAMVQDCFPAGVCWRSRKNNPVNKWYFERSVGTSKLSSSNWTMFWTTAGLRSQHSTLQDYESVCRSVQPSWADNKNILD